MSRSIGGNYTLAAGNPVAPNTTISTTWANATLNDIANALTDSLSRTGLGGMTNPLKLPDGISGAPALTFSAEETTGLYRADDGILSLSVLGTVFLTAGDSELLSPQALHGQKGLTITNSTTNGTGITSTGNGTAAGGVFIGGSSAGNGLTVTGGAGGTGAVIAGGTGGTGATITAGGGNAVGLSVTGAGIGTGAVVTGGGAGWGINATGTIGVVATGTSGGGVTAIGSAGEAGLKAIAGTAASATTAQTAIYCEKGYLTFTGASAGAAVNPNKDVAFTNTATPLHMLKSWVRFTTDGLGGVTFVDGLNVTSVAINGADVDVTFAAAFASATYSAVGCVYQVYADVILNAQTSTVATVRVGTQASGGLGLNVTPLTVDVWFIGRQ